MCPGFETGYFCSAGAAALFGALMVCPAVAQTPDAMGTRRLNRLNRGLRTTVRSLRYGRQHCRAAGVFKGGAPMRRVGSLLSALALTPWCGDDDSPTSPSTGPIQFTAQLSPANEVPPIQGAESSGQGFVIITFNVPRDN